MSPPKSDPVNTDFGDLDVVASKYKNLKSRISELVNTKEQPEKTAFVNSSDIVDQIVEFRSKRNKASSPLAGTPTQVSSQQLPKNEYDPLEIKARLKLEEEKEEIRIKKRKELERYTHSLWVSKMIATALIILGTVLTLFILFTAYVSGLLPDKESILAFVAHFKEILVTLTSVN